MDIILQTFSSIDLGIVPEAMVSAFVASILYFMAKRRGRDGEDVKYDPVRTATTVGIAFIVSMAISLAPGQSLDQATLAAKMTTLGPLVVFIEKAVRSFMDTNAASPTNDSGNSGSSGNTNEGGDNSNESESEPTEKGRFAGRR